MANVSFINQHIISKYLENTSPEEENKNIRNSRFHYFAKLVQTILFRPITKSVALTFRVAKLITWVPVKTLGYKINGFHTESANYFTKEYLKTVKTARDILFTPSVALSAFNGIFATREKFMDDLKPVSSEKYMNRKTTESFQQYSSYLHGFKTFNVIKPEGITEFAAASDASLNTVMASHFLKPDVMAINFGTPNVATFVTEKAEDGSVQTVKVDAKSLWRANSSYHPTNGKIQSGVFLVPTNLPPEALSRFKEAATKMAGRKDITCVNTNCRVLQEAGFSIENISMDKVVFPNTLMAHLLFRNVFFTDSAGTKHKVHFDIINTTSKDLEEYFTDVDTAVLGTRLRHRRRNADTEENQKIRGAAAKAIIASEADRIATDESIQSSSEQNLSRRKVTISVPSFLGDAVAKVWGRHTMYELSLADKKTEIAEAFKSFAVNEEIKLHAFPEKKPSLFTRLKRDIFFSGPAIRFLRRHMMGRSDNIFLNTEAILKHLKSTHGLRLNYVLLDGKMVITKVNANSNKKGAHFKAADWALSKHALLSGRRDVYCSGEMWYDETKGKFMMNSDSGTYKPTFERVQTFANLANTIFNAENLFQAVEVNS